MEWGPTIMAEFDLCLDQAFSALDLSTDPRPNVDRPSASSLVDQIGNDDLLFQTAGLLAATGSGQYGHRVATRPLLVWIRYNILGGLKAVLAAESRPTGSLLGIVALLAGWERAHGDPGACGMHLQALRRIMQLRETAARNGTQPDAEQPASPVLPLPRRLPAGFAFLQSQGLLPPQLLYLIGPLAYADVSLPGTCSNLRQVVLTSTGFGPTGKAAIQAFEEGQVSSEITKHVRLAGLLCVTIVLAGEDDFWTHPLMTGIEPTYTDCQHLRSDALVGIVYDKVLLWTLLVFYTLNGSLYARQLHAFRALLDKLSIPPQVSSWQLLEALMLRYFYHPAFEQRSQSVMEIEQQKAFREESERN